MASGNVGANNPKKKGNMGVKKKSYAHGGRVKMGMKPPNQKKGKMGVKKESYAHGGQIKVGIKPTNQKTVQAKGMGAATRGRNFKV